jgi:hypothetical protein
VPAIASIRGRSFSGASSEIISSSTHIEHGLKPSSSPIASVKAGSPTSASASVRPRKEISKRSFAPVSGARQARLSSRSQVPACDSAAPGVPPPSTARIARSVPASFE